MVNAVNFPGLALAKREHSHSFVEGLCSISPLTLAPLPSPQINYPDDAANNNDISSSSNNNINNNKFSNKPQVNDNDLHCSASKKVSVPMELDEAADPPESIPDRGSSPRTRPSAYDSFLVGLASPPQPGRLRERTPGSSPM